MVLNDLRLLLWQHIPRHTSLRRRWSHRSPIICENITTTKHLVTDRPYMAYTIHPGRLMHLVCCLCTRESESMGWSLHSRDFDRTYKQGCSTKRDYYHVCKQGCYTKSIIMLVSKVVIKNTEFSRVPSNTAFFLTNYTQCKSGFKSSYIDFCRC